MGVPAGRHLADYAPPRCSPTSRVVLAGGAEAPARTLSEAAPTITRAWLTTRGAGVCVAVVDADVRLLGHPAFEGRVVPGYSIENGQQETRAPRSHGTSVAGLAVGSTPEGIGAAPSALTMPIVVPELSARVGHVREVDAIRWAADHGADVICCAWAPPRPTDTTYALSADTRDALHHCLTCGRDGRGCVVVVSAGNDGSDLALNGYASHPGVITVGACNCHDRHPAYSGWGDALWCVFPSNDPQDPVGAGMTYLTTAPVGSLVDGEAFYTTRFGFTSAATAAVAGICALILGANPALTAADVKAVLRDACERIDPDGGTYDATGHSPLYGYGKPDPARAVALAAAAVGFGWDP